MRIVIIGAGSYIGSHLLKQLSQQHPTAVSESFNKFTDKESWLTSILTLIEDEKPNLVYFVSSDQKTYEGPEELSTQLFTNCVAPCAIANSLLKTSLDSRLIIIGTWWQFDEKGVSRPINSYAASKLAAVHLLTPYALNGLRIAQTTLFDVYGPNDKRRKLVNLVFNALAEQTPFDTTLGEQEINLVHIDDVVSGLILAANELQHWQPEKGILTLGLGQKTTATVRQTIEKIQETLNINISVNYGKIPYKKNEPMKTWKNFKKPLQWEAREFSPEEIKKLWNIFLANKHENQ